MSSYSRWSSGKVGGDQLPHPDKDPTGYTIRSDLSISLDNISRFEKMMMEDIEGYTRELHDYLYSFDTQISTRLHEAPAQDLSNLCDKKATLCSEVQS